MKEQGGDEVVRLRLSIGHKKEATSQGTDFLLLDVFSTAFIFSGSEEIAFQDALQNGAFPGILQGAMTSIRDGNDFITAARKSKIPKDLSEWFSMVSSRATNDSEMILETWRGRASRSLAKIEDAISLVITASTLLPVVVAILLLVLGYGDSLLTFSIVFLTVAIFLVVSRWIQELVDPLR